MGPGSTGPQSITGGIRMQNLTGNPNALRHNLASREDRITVLSSE